MAKIKSYTDLEQSKKLAKILPFESADMYYNLGKSNIPNVIYGSHSDFRCYIPCWSLAALLDVLNDYTLQTTIDGSVFVVCDREKIMMPDTYDNPIDACVAMIEKLHELKML